MKPQALPVIAENIPDAMKNERRWMLWRYELQHDRWTKPPYTPDGYRARHNQSAAWREFIVVLDAYLRGGFDGLSFALGDGWAGIDYDKCDVRPAVDGYIERSPSGRGFKVFGRSARMGGEINFATNQSVPFQSARFFAVTGHGHGDPMADLSEAIDVCFPVAIKPVDPFGPAPSFIRAEHDNSASFETGPLYPKLNDRDVVAAIMASPQAVKFRKLADGNMSDYGDDHSRADQALINILAYWCQGDRDQIVRLFQKSGLMRDKFNTRSYREATLLKAGVR